MAIDSISLTFESTSDSGGGEIWYVRLGALLQHIEESIMYHAKVSTQSDSTPILKFDYDVDSNLMYVEKELQTSIDPTICVINRDIPDGGKLYNVTKNKSSQGKGDPFDSPLFPDLPATYGQIMNIYVSMSWILLKMDEIKDAKTNKVSLIDMLNNTLSSINSSLGGTTSLEATIDETTNTVIIRDANPLPDVSLVIAKLNTNNPSLKISDKFALFDLYGYNAASGSASFIKDFSLKTEISPELSTMLTVGATANSTVVGENSTAFSKFNAGLTDRFKTEMVEGNASPSIFTTPTGAINFGNSPLGQTIAQATADTELKATLDKYTSTFAKYLVYLDNLTKGNFTKGEAETYKDALTNIITYRQQYRQAAYNKTNSGKSLFAPSTGFIPFNMSLTMDGLSGMKIYSKFNIDTKFLPANYPDNAEFLIKNIQHKIENNKWFTTIESIVISKGGTDSLVYNKSSNVPAIQISPSVQAVEQAFSYAFSEYNKPSTSILKLAVKTQSNFVFDKLKTPKGVGEVTGYCAGYTYNIAYKLKEFIDKYVANPSSSPSPINFSFQPAGDANSNDHRAKIKNLGIYDEYYLGTYSAAKLKNLSFSNVKWNYGDILNYYAPGASPPHNMHSQIYTGDTFTSGMNGRGIKNASPNSGWTTSTKTNYGGKFIYSASTTMFKVYAYKIKPEYLK